MTIARPITLSIVLLFATCLVGQNVFVNADGIVVDLPIQTNVPTVIASVPIGKALGASADPNATPTFDILATGTIYGANEKTTRWVGLDEAYFLFDTFLCDKSDCSGDIKTRVAESPLITGFEEQGYMGNDIALYSDFSISASLAVENPKDLSRAVLTGSVTGAMERAAITPIPYISLSFGDGNGSASVVSTTADPTDLTSNLYVVLEIRAITWGGGTPTRANATVKLLRVHILR